MDFTCCVFWFYTVAMFHINFDFFYILISEEAKVLTNTQGIAVGKPAAFLLPEKRRRREGLWYSKSHQSRRNVFTILLSHFAPTAMRTATVFCLTIVKRTAACSSFPCTVSTATIFWTQHYQPKKNCTKKSKNKTNLKTERTNENEKL